jgi:hypothetical protein
MNMTQTNIHLSLIRQRETVQIRKPQVEYSELDDVFSEELDDLDVREFFIEKKKPTNSRECQVTTSSLIVQPEQTETQPNTNDFVSYLSTPLYGIESVNFVSASIPYISTASTNSNVHAYYLVLEVPNYGILSDRIYTVDNPYAYKDVLTYNSVNIIAVVSTTGIEPGMSVTGSGIDTDTTVSGVGVGTVTLSKPQTGTVSGTGTFVETDLIASKSEDYFLTVSDTDGLTIGMTVSGTGIETGATISAFADATTVILSLPNTGTVSGTITFNGDIEKTGSGVATANNDQLYVSNVSELSAGMSVTGTGITGGTTISSISDYIVELSAVKTSTINEELTFTRTVTTTISDYLSATEILISPSSQNIEIGMDVTGVGIGAGAKVIDINGTTITLDVAKNRCCLWNNYFCKFS